MQLRAARVHSPERVRQLGRADVLQQVPRDARPHGGEHRVLPGERREHDDLHLGVVGREPLERLDPRHAGQHEVHQHDRGLQRWNQCEGLLAGASLADDLHVLLELEERA
jgi:hypothetical protein